MLKRWIAPKCIVLLMLAGIALSLAGCNTIEGAGKDVKAAGGAVEKAAAGAKRY
jgi:predicted small secreted protein